VGSVRRFLQGSVWLAMTRHPGATAKQLAIETHLAHKTVRNVLQDMRQRGCARVEARNRTDVRWYAIGSKPTCRWGTSHNSLRNLDVPVEVRISRLPRRGRPPPVPLRSSCALQDCWGVGLNVARTSAND
jgi:hypothetical protein